MSSPQQYLPLTRALPAAVALIVWSNQFPVAPAATIFDWNGGGGDGLWGTSTNWSPDGVPIGSLNGDSIVLAGATLGDVTLDVTAGRLSADNVLGDISIVGGTVAPGNSPGLTSVSGDDAQQLLAALEIEIDSAGGVAGTDYDQLGVAGTATLPGTLDVERNCVPDDGTEFDVVTAGARSGTFDPYSGTIYDNAGVPSVLAHLYDQNGPGLSLRASLAGDANLDGVVSITDTLEIGANFGNVVPVSGSITPVPEPSGLLLALIALGAAVGYRRHGER